MRSDHEQLRIGGVHGIVTDEGPPVERRVVAPAAGCPALTRLPAALRDRVVIDVIHDGDCIPARYLRDAAGHDVGFERYAADYHADRDWGATLVAEALARHLGVAAIHRVRIARVLMDFGRFPGLTTAGADYLERFAINYPFSSWLGFEQKQRLLRDAYDAIAAHYDGIVRNSITKIAVHTYDTFNRSGTMRPELSICSQALSYRGRHELPDHFFDPLYPDALAEGTADRVLRDRISLTAEKAGFRVAHNYPYALPDGSVEVRAQVWSFFCYLQDCYLADHPGVADDPSTRMVFEMLQDTNLRRADSEALRGYLHMFRLAPAGAESAFAGAQRAYEAIAAYVHRERATLTEGYERSQRRLSSIGIEVRKDLVWQLDGDTPIAPKPEAAEAIGQVLAEAVLTYFCADRPEIVALHKVHDQAVAPVAPD